MTLDDFVAQLWPTLDVTAKTLDNYQRSYTNHLKPTLGHKLLGEVTKADIGNALVPLRPQTKYAVLMAIRVIYREAINTGLAESNPAATIKPPKVRPKSQPFLTIEQVMSSTFGNHTDSVRFLALHGLRWGEFAALTPEDIHDGRVHITKSIHGQTKSKAGVRSVPYLGHFPAKIPCRHTMMRTLRKRGVTIHSLRKTYAYGLKASGVHVTTAAKLMGHANPMVTLGIYTGVLDNEVDTAGDQLRNQFGL